MKFEDLSEFDIRMIKDHAVNLFVTTKVKDRHKALTDSVLGCISAKGFIIVGHRQDLISAATKEIAPLDKYGSSSSTLSSDEIIKLVFKFLADHKLDIVRDETVNPTWTTPKQSWYTKAESYRKPWTY